MKWSQIIVSAIVGAVAAFMVAMSAAVAPHGTTAQETAYERVLRTKTLRCGYADWPPHVFVKAPTTGKVSGIMADLTEAIAGKLALKVEWAENTGWGSFIESLKTHRIDAFCAGGWRNAERGKYVTYTSPIFYNAVYPYARMDDHRFDKDLTVANDAGIRISAMDGEMSDVIAKRHFPKAVEVSVPQLGQITDILVNVATNKADIVFNEPSFVDDYMKANPGKLRRVSDVPFETYQTSLNVEIHETQLRDMLDSALVELINNGTVDQIISKYNGDPKVFLRVAKPYETR